MPCVLHINDYPLDAGGGAEVVMRRTIELLRARGVRVETFTCADLANARRTPLRYIDNPGARAALAARLDAVRPDVVHLHNYYHVLSPGILATLAEWKRTHPLRVVMTAHDYHLACPNAGGSWFRWWTGRREPVQALRLSFAQLVSRRWDDRTVFHSCLKLMQYAWNYRVHQRARALDLLICPSRFVQTMLTATGLTTCWLPHPAPPLPAIPAERRGPLHLVFAGRIEPEKGLREFLEMAPAGVDFRMTVIGDGSDRPRCETVCAARGLRERVAFVGRLPHAETLARMAGCHVLVQPSRVLETYGLTLIEALAMGANLLVSNRGAAREIVDDSGIGFLYDVDDATSLALQFRRIVQEHGQGTLNRFAAERFLESRSDAAHVDALLGIYAGNANVARRLAA